MTAHRNRHQPFDRKHALATSSAPLCPFSSKQEPARHLEEGFSHSANHALRTLLVPLDGTPHAEHALPYALAIARRSGARIRLVRVHPHMNQVEPWQMCSVYEWNIREKREAYNYLADLAARIAATDSVTVQTRVIDSVDAVEALKKESAHADLVVMASRRRGFLRRLFSPSVANALRRRIRTPALFVQGYSYPADLTADPIARHILVPLNGSRHAENVLGVATAVSRLEGATLSLVNVQNQDWSLGVFEHTMPSSYLIGIANDVKRAVPHVDAHILTTEESSATAVASFAKRRNVDVIALATRSEAEWTQILQGNFADALIRETNLPLLVLDVDVERKRSAVTTVVEL